MRVNGLMAEVALPLLGEVGKKRVRNQTARKAAQILVDKSLVAAGEWWRLLTVALLHESPIHLAFNMYALYLVGPVVERIYGWKLFILIYLACDLAASVASLSSATR